MTDIYAIQNSSEILSPGLVLFRDIVDENIRRTIETVGDPARLRPHCKTHKMQEVAEMVIGHGVTKHKCATFAEAEMLAEAGAQDIFLAYNPVGPNIDRAVAFQLRYPNVTFSVTADHEDPVRRLGAAAHSAGTSIHVLMDVDTGLHRTGVAPDQRGISLYRLIAKTDGLIPNGLHCYDGHHHQRAADERTAAVRELWVHITDFREQLQAAGLSVPRIVAGGTPSFPMYARIDDPTVECSPGTCLIQDAGYGGKFADMQFTPGAVLLTRVISRPTANRLTCDLGTKAVASDPPAGHRVSFPELPDAVAVLHNEEHLVLETAEAERYQPGDELIAIPIHICPTTALHKSVTVVAEGRVVETWNVVARDRQLTI